MPALAPFPESAFGVSTGTASATIAPPTAALAFATQRVPGLGTGPASEIDSFRQRQVPEAILALPGVYELFDRTLGVDYLPVPKGLPETSFPYDPLTRTNRAWVVPKKQAGLWFAMKQASALNRNMQTAQNFWQVFDAGSAPQMLNGRNMFDSMVTRALVAGGLRVVPLRSKATTETIRERQNVRKLEDLKREAEADQPPEVR